MKKIFFTLAALVCSFSVWAQENVTEFDVTVTARENSSGLQDEINCAAGKGDAMADVVKLKITGTINSYDFMIIRNKMVNLQELDLGEANIVENSYEYYTGYHSENDKLGSYLFYSNKNLSKIKIPKSVKTIGEFAFSYSNIVDVDFGDNVEEIQYGAFRYCYNLSTVNLPSKLKTLDTWVFNGCTSLKDVYFPIGLKKIGSGAFNSCSALNKVVIPVTVMEIADKAFLNCNNIRDIYTWSIVPIEIFSSTFSSSITKTATLHVPLSAKKLYYWDTEWSQFVNVTEFNEPYEYFYLSDRKDLELSKIDARIDGTPDADFNTGSGLIVEGDESQDLGEVNLESNGDITGSIIGGNSKTETSGANVNIDNLKIQIAITKGKWYFFAFPFDIPCANIHFNGQYVWRYYDGEYRAAEGSGAWKDNKTDKLLANKGYIFQASKDGTLTLNVGKTSIGGEDKMIALESHKSDNAQDASWNLVGNPFTSYYELSSLGYNAPITVWNGNGYEAFSPKDDDFTIYPFQAFFVQKPAGTEDVAFGAAGRETLNQANDPNHKAAAKARRQARAKSGVVRELVNIEVSDGENTDKTRVVFNETSSMDYEMECDAAKFFTASVPQIYTYDAKNAQYAINERPTGNGTVKMGFTANKDGEYTIAASRMDCPMLLRDLELNITHNLSDGDYTFQANSGEHNNRFELVRGDGATGIANAEGMAEEKAEYFGVNGVKSDKNAKGVVIEKDKTSAKKVVKK